MALSLLKANLPCRVRFAGWESDTFRLGRSGWKISYQEDHHRGECQLLLFMPVWRIQCWAHARNSFRSIEWRAGGQQEDRLPEFEVQKAASDFIVRMSGSAPLPIFKVWADTDPSFSMIEETEMSFYHTPLFLEKEAAPAEELIVDPATVSELLEQIRQRQSPTQAEIRARDRSRNRPLLHAKILTFPQREERMAA